MNNKKLGLFLIIILSMVLASCTTEGAMTSSEIDPPPVINDPRVIVEGTLLPINNVSLAFGNNGKIENIFINEGEEVSQGQILAQLGNSEIIIAEIENANLALTQAKNDKTALFESAPIAYAQTWQNVINTKEMLDQAQSDLDAFDEDDFQDRLQEAKADVLEAGNEFQDAQEEFEDYMDLDEDNPTREKYKTILDNALEDLNNKKTELTSIQNEFSQLEKNLAQAKAEYEQAANDMEDLEDGPKQSDIELIEARIRAAEAQIAASETRLDDLTIIAPFDGTIISLNYDENEFVSAGTPLILLADTSLWKVETDDLTEFDVIKIKEGQSVSIEPEVNTTLSYKGSVTSIDALSQLKEGDRTYTASIIIEDDLDDRLRWGMSMIVIFE